MKPARTRPLAEQDLVERTRYYATAEGADLAERFFTAAVEAVRSVEDMPGIGSPLVGERIGIPELRRVGVEGFPCGWFYVERIRPSRCGPAPRRQAGPRRPPGWRDLTTARAAPRAEHVPRCWLSSHDGTSSHVVSHPVQTTNRPHSDHDWAGSGGTGCHDGQPKIVVDLHRRRSGRMWITLVRVVRDAEVGSSNLPHPTKVKVQVRGGFPGRIHRCGLRAPDHRKTTFAGARDPIVAVLSAARAHHHSTAEA